LSDESIKDGVKDGVNLSQNQIRIIKAIKYNPKMTAEELSVIVGIKNPIAASDGVYSYIGFWVIKIYLAYHH